MRKPSLLLANHWKITLRIMYRRKVKSNRHHLENSKYVNNKVKNDKTI